MGQLVGGVHLTAGDLGEPGEPVFAGEAAELGHDLGSLPPVEAAWAFLWCELVRGELPGFGVLPRVAAGRDAAALGRAVVWGWLYGAVAQLLKFGSGAGSGGELVPQVCGGDVGAPVHPPAAATAALGFLCCLAVVVAAVIRCDPGDRQEAVPAGVGDRRPEGLRSLLHPRQRVFAFDAAAVHMPQAVAEDELAVYVEGWRGGEGQAEFAEYGHERLGDGGEVGVLAVLGVGVLADVGELGLEFGERGGEGRGLV